MDACLMGSALAGVANSFWFCLFFVGEERGSLPMRCPSDVHPLKLDLPPSNPSIDRRRAVCTHNVDTCSATRPHQGAGFQWRPCRTTNLDSSDCLLLFVVVCCCLLLLFDRMLDPTYHAWN